MVWQPWCAPPSGPPPIEPYPESELSDGVCFRGGKSPAVIGLTGAKLCRGLIAAIVDHGVVKAASSAETGWSYANSYSS